MKKIILLISLFALLNNSCTPECQVALADLVCSISVEVDKVNAGETFRFTNLIGNIKDVAVNCGTAIAGQTQTKMDVAYKQNMDDDYQDISTDNFFVVPPIGEEETAMENYDVQFTTPGYYKIVTYADGKFEVDERAENNNESAIVGEGKTASLQKGILIKVNVSNAIDKNQEPEMVILSRTVTVN